MAFLCEWIRNHAPFVNFNDSVQRAETQQVPRETIQVISGTSGKHREKRGQRRLRQREEDKETERGKRQREREASGGLWSSFRRACDRSHHTLHTKFAPYALVAVQSNSGKDPCVLSSEGK